jgi:hypothetical protein
MIRKIARQWFLLMVAALLAGCSTTTLSGAWKSPEFQGQVSKIYVVGVSKSETNRRILESQFAEALTSYNVTGIPSYKDLPDAQSANQAAIEARMKQNAADSMLITRLIDTRTEEVVTPARITRYRSWPNRVFVSRYEPMPHYRYWGSYYDRCCYEMIYEPPTISQYEVFTIEANLYEARGGELIWAAQLETVNEYDLEKQVGDFVQTVIQDLQQQGLI